MSYQISEQLISYNRSHQYLSPQGFVIHSTATPEASATDEYNYFNSGDRRASVQYLAGWDKIIRIVPENEVSWGCGYTGNHKFIQVEMCESGDSSKFDDVWDKTVWLVADACVRYGWNTNDNVYSHRGISQLYKQTDHTDPIEYLASHGKTWDDLLSAINQEITNIKNNNQGDDILNICVVYFSPADFSSAIIVANQLGGVAMFCRNTSPNVHPDAMKSSKVITIGGPKLNHPNETFLSGNTASDTLIAVANYLQGK